MEAISSAHIDGSSEHEDHDDPAAELQRVIKQGDLDPDTWEAPGGRTWHLHHEEDDDGQQLLVLELLSEASELVCQAYAPLPTQSR